MEILLACALASVFSPIIVHWGRSEVAAFVARAWAVPMIACSAMLVAFGGWFTVVGAGFGLLQIITLTPRARRLDEPAPTTF